MSLFSVIIPTLQRAPQLAELVAMLSQHPLVDEVLIINNAITPLPFRGDKVRVLQPERNMYVNAAWNWGAREARSDLLAFANDDVMFEPDLLAAVRSRLVRRRVGMIGPHASAFNGTKRRRAFRSVYKRGHGMGTLMFMRRESFTPIPEDLLIWCGDDWLFRHQRARSYTFRGWRVDTPMSVTSGAAEFSHIGHSDTELYYREYERADDPYVLRFRREAAVKWYFGEVVKRVNRLAGREVVQWD